MLSYQRLQDEEWHWHKQCLNVRWKLRFSRKTGSIHNVRIDESS